MAMRKTRFVIFALLAAYRMIFNQLFFSLPFQLQISVVDEY